MSRIEKFGRRRQADASAAKNSRQSDVRDGLAEGGLPSRRIIHPSNKKQMTQWLYRVQIFIYLLLVIGLLMWGKRMYGL
ncbi:hypothetical protein [Paenibacillus spongiae]|uniref:Uncharacterized protein n=1 Tax=Paenibacillus spongiae TaxID=2909671 RepID=A0ABY5SFV9_9BACL|nr:hypothetical protein [Paenibacillus spongiae]UVI32360.1 hypothetical protein L1F29_11300 [Paenibacillus spongiae]